MRTGARPTGRTAGSRRGTGSRRQSSAQYLAAPQPSKAGASGRKRALPLASEHRGYRRGAGSQVPLNGPEPPSAAAACRVDHARPIPRLVAHGRPVLTRAPLNRQSPDQTGEHMARADGSGRVQPIIFRGKRYPRNNPAERGEHQSLSGGSPGELSRRVAGPPWGGRRAGRHGGGRSTNATLGQTDRGRAVRRPRQIEPEERAHVTHEPGMQAARPAVAAKGSGAPRVGDTGIEPVTPAV